jgi:hypothetical protein
MTVSYNSNAVSDSILFSVDPGNKKSFDGRENRFLYSEEFNNAYWNKSGLSVSTNNRIAPNGTLTAEIANATSNAGTLNRNISFSTTNQDKYTFSVYLKQGTASQTAPTIFFNGGGFVQGVINWSTMSMSVGGDTGNQASGKLTILNDGWVRAEITARPSSASSNDANCVVYAANNSTGTVFIWGAQFERSESAGEYIRTTTSTVTRPTTLLNIPHPRPNSLVLTGGVSYGGTNEGTLYFDGVNDYGTVATDLLPGNQMTAEAWYKSEMPTPDNRQAWLIGKEGSYRLRFSPDGFIQALIGTANNAWGSPGTFLSLDIGPSSSWRHLAFSYDGSNIRLYLNGELIGTTTTQITGAIVSGVGTTIVGFPYSAANAYYKGYMGPIRVYSRGLTEKEIKQNFNAQRSRFGL